MVLILFFKTVSMDKPGRNCSVVKEIIGQQRILKSPMDRHKDTIHSSSFDNFSIWKSSTLSFDLHLR